MNPIKGKLIPQVFFDEIVKTAQIPTLFDYQLELLKSKGSGNLVLCSTPVHGDKTKTVSFFATLWKKMAWEERVKHHNAPVKVQFT